MMTRIGQVAIVLFAMMTGPVFADIIEDDAALFGGPESFSFQLTQSIPDGKGLLAFTLSLEFSGDIIVSYNSIAELVAAFDVDAGTLFDADYVTNNIPLSINDGSYDNGVVHLDVGESFYFCYWDDRHYWEPGNIYGPDYGDNYGWAEIMRTDNGLELIASATAIDRGIIVGSTNKIPEPAFVPLAAMLGIIVGNGRKRQKNDC